MGSFAGGLAALIADAVIIGISVGLAHALRHARTPLSVLAVGTLEFTGNFTGAVLTILKGGGYSRV